MTILDKLESTAIEFRISVIEQTLSCVVAQTILFFVCSASLGEEWWQFRGPNSGHSAASALPLRWDDFFHEPQWKTHIPGKGWSSPIVVGDRIWLTSAEVEALAKDSEADHLAQLPLGSRDLSADAAVKLFAVELDAQTGELLRRIDLFSRDAPPTIHLMNSYASPTPTTNGRQLFCHFGALGTACIDLTSGQVLWKRQLFVEDITGGAASPVLWSSCLILACDGADQQFLVALDQATGETRWQVARPNIAAVDDSQRRAFSTPLIVHSAGHTQLISMSAQWLISLNPLDGSEWWRAHVGLGYSAVPTPVFDGRNDRVFVCTGFPKAELVAVDTTGSGDVTDSAILWRYSRQVPEVSSPLLVGRELYLASTAGVASCLDAETGTLHWQERIGGNFTASPLFCDGRIYLTSNSGVTTVIQPGKTYVELATNEMFGETFSSLGIYRDRLLIRTNPFLFCIQNEPKD